MVQNQQLHANFNRLNVNVELSVPNSIEIYDYELWGKCLTENNPWTFEENKPSLPTLLDSRSRLYILSFLQLSRLLLELGRLPVFIYPLVTTVTPNDHESNQYQLVLELPLIQLVPQSAYQIPLKFALFLCKWMAQNPPTQENKEKVFNAIEKEVITLLHRLVPAGKSTIPVLRVAHSLGIPFLHLGLGVYQLGWGSKARRLDRSTTGLDSAIGAKLSHNKVSTASLLRIAGLPAPVHAVVAEEREAIKAAGQIGFPVVVKPTDKERGEGVSVDIADEASLKIAFTNAQKLSNSKQVVIERQVSGVCHRLFVVEGRLLYAVKRLPMGVFGDGVRSVNKLVDDEVTNQQGKPPWLRSEINPIDELALNAIRSEGLSPETVPSKGAFVSLRRIESTEWGGVDEDVTHIIHPENVKIALEATKLFGLQIAGIDIISADISNPWYENGAIINEVNFAPLLGGAEISRSYILQFFSWLIDGDGKIPIETFETEEAALQRQADFLKQGLRCFFTSSEKTIDASGKLVIMPLIGVEKRVMALICRGDVDAIVRY